MAEPNVRVALVGCGNIATAYVEQMRAYDHVELVGFADLRAERAEAFAQEHGRDHRSHQSIDEGRAVAANSTFTPPAPMDWAE